MGLLKLVSSVLFLLVLGFAVFIGYLQRCACVMSWLLDSFFVRLCVNIASTNQTKPQLPGEAARVVLGRVHASDERQAGGAGYPLQIVEGPEGQGA